MKNEDSVLQKLCERLGCPKLLAMLTTTPWRNVQPILIRVLRDRATQKNASMLLHEYESKGEFYGVSATGQHALHNFASAFYATLPPTYQSVELSPITPFGLNAVLTKVSQDVTLSSIRGSEVVSDPTTPMALECASRRKALLITEETRHQTVNLATLHRVLRLQPFDKQKGYMQHFRLSGLCAGGRDTGRGAFFIENISGHISIWLDFVNRLNQDGYEFRDVEVKISDIRFLENLITFLNIPREIVNQHSLDDDFDLFQEYNIDFPKEIESVVELTEAQINQNHLEERFKYLLSMENQILQPLRGRYPQVRFCFDFSRKAGLGYYQHICYHIFAINRNKRVVQLADGGSVDWLGKLLSSSKELMVVSGFGFELVQNLFNQ